jgi:ParB-like chromosome segregation protein Spo0J
MSRHDLKYRRVDDLKVNLRNPRTHSKKQVRQIADSIRQFGFTNPVLLDEDDVILAGHGRLAAAKLLGFATVPTIRLSDLSEAEKRAYALADNKLAENAGWDSNLLAIELQYLVELDSEFDVSRWCLGSGGNLKAA